MGMLTMTGRWANILDEIVASPVASPAADSLFPVTNLGGMNPGRECAFGSVATGSMHTIDLDIVGAAGEFESGTIDSPLSNGSSGTGTVDVSATAPHTGTKSARLNSFGAGLAVLVLTKTLKTGRTYRFECWARNTTGGAGAIQTLYAFNLDTQHFLQSSGGAWGTSPASVRTYQGATYSQLTFDFTVESFEACGGKDTVTVQMQMYSAQNVNEYVYFDDVRAWPMVDVVGIFGHNIVAGAVPQIRFSFDNFSVSDTLRDSMVVKSPAFYKIPSSSVQTRWIRVIYNPGVGNQNPVRIGELFLGQAFAPQRGVSATVGTPEVSVARPQIVSDFQTFALSDHPVTSLNLPMHLLTGVNYKDFRNEIIERSQGSLYPLVVVPDDVLEPDLIVMGKLAGAQAYRRLPVDQRETSLIVDGLPYATVVA